jgi:hypothetical protein
MEEFIEVIAKKIKRWNRILDSLELFEVFVTKDFQLKNGPTYLSTSRSAKSSKQYD